MRRAAPLLLTLAMSATTLVAGSPDRPSVHGMLIVGETEVFLSHLPMFHTPHDYQVILRARLPEATRMAYAEDRRRTGTRVYTLVPETFVLPDVVEGRRPFKAEIWRGHFERGGTPILKDVPIEIAEVVHFRRLVPASARPAGLEYLVFGAGEETFLAHVIATPPDFDQIVSVRPGKTLPARLTFDRKGPLQDGDRIRSGAAELEVGTVYYTETDDLKAP